MNCKKNYVLSILQQYWPYIWLIFLRYYRDKKQIPSNCHFDHKENGIGQTKIDSFSFILIDSWFEKIRNWAFSLQFILYAELLRLNLHDKTIWLFGLYKKKCGNTTASYVNLTFMTLPPD